MTILRLTQAKHVTKVDQVFIGNTLSYNFNRKEFLILDHFRENIEYFPP